MWGRLAAVNRALPNRPPLLSVLLISRLEQGKQQTSERAAQPSQKEAVATSARNSTAGQGASK